MLCSTVGCRNQARSHGLCRKHWAEAKQEPCEFTTCSNWAYSGSLCFGHRNQRRKGQPLRELRKVAPKGSGTVHHSGYRVVSAPEHPNAWATGYIYEHTVVAAQMLGRALMPYENVHHRNGDKLDNRPENLEVWVTKQPRGQRIADKVLYAREILRIYGTDKEKTAIEQS